MSMLIAFIALFAGLYLVKRWLASHGHDISLRGLIFLLVGGSAAFSLVSFFAEFVAVADLLKLIPVIAIVAFLWWFFTQKEDSVLVGAAADVLEDNEKMRALAAPFDPSPYIQKAKKSGRDEVFMGLDQDRKPILFPRAKLTKNHIEILGESGVGKSSLAGVLLSQLAAAGEVVIVFDPKADRMLPGVLARAGKAHGFPVVNIDLRYGQPPQINPFLGARQDQVEELLQVALELGKTGQGAVDFYRGKDREATGWMAAAFEDGETSMPELLEKAAEDDRVTENENLWREFRQIARIPAFQVHQGQGGHDLESLLSRAGVIYVTGSTTKLEVQAGQKLLLQRILQILDERRDQSRPVAIFLDELKYILSPAALRAAGTIRDRNCHLLFAHQSLGDLSDCPGLDPKAVRGAVWGNTGVKVCYKMLDEGTARELSGICGERASLERRSSENDNGLTIAESIGRASHMPVHVFTHLPKPTGQEASVGVVIGDGTAYFLSTRWLESGPTPEPIPAPPLDKKSDDAPVIATAAAAAFAVTGSAAELLEVGEVTDRTPDVSAVPAAEIPMHVGEQEDDILATDFDDFLK